MIKAQGGIRKSGILSPWRNPLAPGDRFYRRVSAITRPILNFNGTQYATLSEPVVLYGDFEIEIVLLGHPGNSTESFLSGFLEADPWLYANGESYGNNIALRYDSGSGFQYLSNPAPFKDGRIHRITLSRSGSRITLGVDGNEVSRSLDVPFIINNLFASRNASSLGYGSLFSFKVWDESSELVTDLRFDEPDTIYQRDYTAPYGELIENGNFAFGSDGWTSFNSSFSTESSVAEFVTTSAYGYIEQDFGFLADGSIFELKFDVLPGTSNSLVVVNTYEEDRGTISDVQLAGRRFGVGSHVEYVYSDGLSKIRVRNEEVGATTRVSNISVKRWSGAILQNTLPGDWETISKRGVDNHWLGVELADQSVATIPGEYLGGDTDQYWYWDVTPLNNGDTVLITSTMYGEQLSLNPCGWSTQTGIPGTPDWRLSGGFSGVAQLGGVHTPTSSDGVAARLFCSSQPDTDITFTNISVKRYLEYAEGAL